MNVATHAGSADAWDAAVLSMPGVTHGHLSGWDQVIGGVLGHQALRLIATDGSGAPVGGLPLVHVRTLLGNYLISMPFLNTGGPVGSAPAREALSAWAVEEAKQRGCKLLELRDRYTVAPRLNPSDRKITVTLPLPSNPEELLKGFGNKLRKNINKPQRAGMELRVGPDQVGAFWQVLARNMRDLGTPVLPVTFFEAIARAFPDSSIFAALYHEGRPVGGQCSFVCGDTLEMVWGSTLREFNALKPSSYLTWAFMEMAMARGCREFDFGRCTPDSGTHQFKRQWGGEDVPLPWSTWSKGGVAAPPSPDRPLFRIAVRVWQRLPLAVTNRLGPRLSRMLP